MAESPLELLHPDGTVDRVWIVGSACPPGLARPRADGKGTRTLLVLAPSRRECGRWGWLPRTIAGLAPELDAHALVYVIAPLGRRRKARSVLRRAGLVPAGTFLHLPSGRRASHVVAAHPAALLHALASLVIVRRWKRRLAALAFARPTGARLVRFLPAAAFVMTRPDAARPYSWVAREAPSADGLRSATLSIGWGGSSAVVHAFLEGSETPSFVAKVGLTERTREARAREAAMLVQLAGDAATAGVVVPALRRPAHDSIVVETAIAGRPVAALLADRPKALPSVLATLADRLERLHIATETRREADERLVAPILARARALAPDLRHSQSYLSCLERLGSQAFGRTVPLVAAHHDLTMVNVLQGPDGELGIVDWEFAEMQALPLTDFFYAAADAVAATSRYSDRPGAFAAAFLRDGPVRHHVEALQSRLCSRLELEAPLVELCFHSCWLMHALNERSKTPRIRPFLAIVQLLADASTDRS